MSSIPLTCFKQGFGVNNDAKKTNDMNATHDFDSIIFSSCSILNILLQLIKFFLIKSIADNKEIPDYDECFHWSGFYEFMKLNL